MRTHDLERVRDDPHGHELLSVVAAVHHERVGQALDDGALCFAEALDGVAAGRVRDVDWGSDLDVVAAEGGDGQHRCHAGVNLPVPIYALSSQMFLCKYGFVLQDGRCS